MSKTTPLGTPYITTEQIEAGLARARVERSNAVRRLIGAPIANAFKFIWRKLTGSIGHSAKPTVTGRA